ncbi:MAG: adenosylmethionine decarboxylase [Spirochaetota bacterium]
MALLGIHLIADFFECDSSVINNIESVEKILTESVIISGATLIKPFFHRFSPQGISGIIVVAESHFSIHTWPEHSAAAVDIFSCGDFNHIAALKLIKEKIKSANNSVVQIARNSIQSNDANNPDLQYKKIIL